MKKNIDGLNTEKLDSGPSPSECSPKELSPEELEGVSAGGFLNWLVHEAEAAAKYVYNKL